MDEKGRTLAQSVWTRMDRKAGAITELTIRQLRHRVSTWVVLSVGALVMALLLAFYISYYIQLYDASSYFTVVNSNDY